MWVCARVCARVCNRMRVCVFVIQNERLRDCVTEKEKGMVEGERERECVYSGACEVMTKCVRK